MNADEQQVGWQEQSRLCPGLPGYLISPARNSEHNQETQPRAIMTFSGTVLLQFCRKSVLMKHLMDVRLVYVINVLKEFFRNCQADDL